MISRCCLITLTWRSIRAFCLGLAEDVLYGTLLGDDQSRLAGREVAYRLSEHAEQMQEEAEAVAEAVVTVAFSR